MDCLKTNKLPTHWSTLLTTSTSKLVDDDLNSTNFVDASWFADSSHSTVSTDTSTISSPSQRELHSFSLSSQREISSSTPPHQGWNSTHCYETRFQEKFTAHTSIFDTTSNTTPFDADLYSAYIAIQDSYLIHSSTDISFLEHYACAAQSNPDVLHFGSMIRDPDCSHFEQDMICEVSDLIRTDTIEITLQSCIPLGLKVLPAIWSFRQKCTPNWSILKYKDRLCPHGGHQVEGEHFWATYAPIVNWRTICLVLILSLLADLKSHQIDYVNSFTQAPADCVILCPFLPVLLFKITP
jgi:hypothetical protein